MEGVWREVSRKDCATVRVRGGREDDNDNNNPSSVDRDLEVLAVDRSDFAQATEGGSQSPNKSGVPGTTVPASVRRDLGASSAVLKPDSFSCKMGGRAGGGIAQTCAAALGAFIRCFASTCGSSFQ